ncbi:MAG: hypothetical protein K2V71_05885 [Methylotenera sp.]|nr:hypothetical protein [Methylotenera sp.]
MSANNIKFFSAVKNKKIISKLKEALENISLKDEKLESMLNDLGFLIANILNNTEFYDTNCQFNISWIGEGILSDIIKFTEDYSPNKASNENDEGIKNLYVSFYRFLCEADFAVNGNLVFELKRIIKNIDSLFYLFSDHQKQQLTYTRFFMVADILKELIKHPNIADIKTFNEKYEQIEKIKSGWDAELEAKEAAVGELKKKLDNYKTAFNFVGLSQGFGILASNKTKELKWARFVLIGLGLLSALPVSIEIYLFLFKSSELLEYKNLLVYSIFPTLTLQIILIYFFKVALVNFKSIKAQLLQIDLRKTLCEFIQSYADYANDIKTKDSSSLEKFENLIFSGLITNEENLPSTFDGLEQIGKIIQSVKTSS